LHSTRQRKRLKLFVQKINKILVVAEMILKTKQKTPNNENFPKLTNTLMILEDVRQKYTKFQFTMRQHHPDPS